MAQQISFGIWIQYGRIMARMHNAHPQSITFISKQLLQQQWQL